MKLSELIAELQVMQEALGGDTIVCTDDGQCGPESPLAGIQGQVNMVKGQAERCIVLIAEPSAFFYPYHMRK